MHTFDQCYCHTSDRMECGFCTNQPTKRRTMGDGYSSYEYGLERTGKHAAIDRACKLEEKLKAARKEIRALKKRLAELEPINQETEK